MKDLDILDASFPRFRGDETAEEKIEAIMNYLQNQKQALQIFAGGSKAE